MLRESHRRRRCPCQCFRIVQLASKVLRSGMRREAPQEGKVVVVAVVVSISAFRRCDGGDVPRTYERAAWPLPRWLFRIIDPLDKDRAEEIVAARRGGVDGKGAVRGLAHTGTRRGCPSARSSTRCGGAAERRSKHV